MKVYKCDYCKKYYDDKVSLAQKFTSRYCDVKDRDGDGSSRPVALQFSVTLYDDFEEADVCETCVVDILVEFIDRLKSLGAFI